LRARYFRLIWYPPIVALVAITAWRAHFAGLALPAATSVAGAPFMDQDLQDFFHQVETLLMHGKFDKLETQAATYRDVDVRFAGGYPKLHYFYEALGVFHGKPCGCKPLFTSLLNFSEKEAAIQAWMAAKPGSITAAIAMARLWTNYGWDARGPAFAEKVPDSDMRLFADRINRGLAYLRALDPRSDANIYQLYMQSTGTLLGGNGRSAIYMIYQHATESFHTYYPYYMVMANYLQPKWFGTQGDLDQFLRSLLKEDRDTGLIEYSFAAEALDKQNVSGNVYKEFGMDWPTLKRALALREQRYGSSNRLRNVELRLATGAADRAYAGELAQQIGNKWDPTIWSGWDGYAAVAAWATAGN
jgi:hypothetical protein